VVTYTNYVLFPNNTGDGRLLMEASSDDHLNKWRIFVPGTPGTYSCDGDVTVLQLIGAAHASGSGVASGGVSCSITVLKAEDGVYHGTFEATLEASPKGIFKTITEGTFYYSMYGGPTGGTGLGADQQGASFMLKGGRYTYTKASSLAFETYAGVLASPLETNSQGYPLGIQIHTVPNATGTYNCGEGEYYRALNVWFYWKGASYSAGSRQSANPAGPAGSSCTVNVTSVGATFEGTFQGTFVKDGESLVVTDGQFRLTGT
jgi:hypothetical protein